LRTAGHNTSDGEDASPATSHRGSVSRVTAGSEVMFGSSGPKPLYEARLGNVAVSYGGHDKVFAARVAAAVSAIKR